MGMANIVDLLEWARRREGPGAESGPGNPPSDETASDETVARLERAIERLVPLVSRALDAGERLQPRVETELLAIMGELTVGLVGEAAGRAERLVRKLQATG
jgi:hypothetical protein